MYTYYSSFNTGTQKIIKDNLTDCHIQKLMDGGILYTTSKTPEEVEKIRFFNNTFLVIQTFENTASKSLEEIIDSTNLNDKTFLKVIKNDNKSKEKYKRFKTFHIFSSNENQLVSVDKKVLGRFENKLEKISNLRVDFSKKITDFEFWFLKRSEDVAFFMLRLTKNKKKLKDGELHIELCNILCLLSEPEQTDIVLDCFCGSGSIPLERSRICDYKGIFACDKDESSTKKLKEEIKKINNKKLNRSFFVKNLDFLKNNFDNDFFTKIITDPPWGFFEKIDNIEKFYLDSIGEMHRILKLNGLIVLLAANKEEMSNVLNNFKGKLELVDKFDILVSGKKASIYKIKKVS